MNQRRQKRMFGLVCLLFAMAMNLFAPIVSSANNVTLEKKFKPCVFRGNEVVSEKEKLLYYKIASQDENMDDVFTVRFSITPEEEIFSQEPTDIALVLDSSASMKINGIDRMRPTIRALMNFTESLFYGRKYPNVQMGMIQFSYDAKKVFDLNQDYSTMNRKIFEIKALGATFLMDGLVEGNKLLQTSPNKKIILLVTDGMPTLSAFPKVDFSKIEEITEAEAKRIGVDEAFVITKYNSYDRKLPKEAFNTYEKLIWFQKKYQNGVMKMNDTTWFGYFSEDDLRAYEQKYGSRLYPLSSRPHNLQYFKAPYLNGVLEIDESFYTDTKKNSIGSAKDPSTDHIRALAIREAEKIKNQGVKIVTVGIGMEEEVSRKFLEEISSEGKYYEAGNLANHLDEILKRFIVLQDLTLTEKVEEQYEVLSGESGEIEALILPDSANFESDYRKRIEQIKQTFDSTSNTFRFSNVRLRKDEKVIVEYKVKLKDDYKNKTWYPINQKTNVYRKQELNLVPEVTVDFLNDYEAMGDFELVSTPSDPDPKTDGPEVTVPGDPKVIPDPVPKVIIPISPLPPKPPSPEPPSFEPPSSEPPSTEPPSSEPPSPDVTPTPEPKEEEPIKPDFNTEVIPEPKEEEVPVPETVPVPPVESQPDEETPFTPPTVAIIPSPSSPEPPTPESPTTESPEPEPLIPTFGIDEVPDPSSPDSPDTIIITDEDGTPLGSYTKKRTPDGKVIYVDEDGVPLGKTKIIAIGDFFVEETYLWIAGLAILLALFLRKSKKRLYRK